MLTALKEETHGERPFGPVLTSALCCGVDFAGGLCRHEIRSGTPMGPHYISSLSELNSAVLLNVRRGENLPGLKPQWSILQLGSGVSGSHLG